MMKTKEQVKLWEKIYREYFNIKIELDTSGLKESRLYPLVVLKGINISKIFNILSKKFNVEVNTGNEIFSLENFEKGSTRKTNNSYVLWVDPIKHSNEWIFGNKSTNDLHKKGHMGITLLERLLFELFYWELTGRHIFPVYSGTSVWTLCTESIYEGYAPFVGFEEKSETLRIGRVAIDKYYTNILTWPTFESKN